MQKLISISMVTIFICLLSVLFSCSSTKIVASQVRDLVRLFAAENTTYVIKEDIDLNGKTIRIGKGSTLDFRGGSFSNGTIVGNNTKVKAANYVIFKRGCTRYRAYKEVGTSGKLPPNLKKEYYNSIVIEGSWSNRKCGTNWTGVLDENNEDVMLAVKNYVVLHQRGVRVTFPTFNAYGYENTRLPGGYIIDFNNSTISYPDNLEVWDDKTIGIPAGTRDCPLETGYGFIFLKSNTTIANLTLDGKADSRQSEPLRLGVSCLLCIDNAENVLVENVTLINALGPGIVSHAKSKDITFKNCRFFNIGEHVMYGHQYLGFCHFESCTFDTWDSERLSEFRDGIDYLYKHAPLSSSKDVSYDDLYKFDLSFTNCSFNNPKRVNSQGRTLGGFLTGDFPVVVKLNNCCFIGEQPILNPGGKEITERTGLAFRMIARNCDGAPNPYASKANYNIIAEYYDCVNIPFRTVYSKRYERCKMFLDIYEDNFENVTHSFESEFSEALVIKDCELFDRGGTVKINHPLCHRPVVFDNCVFTSTTVRKSIMEFVSVKSDLIPRVEFISCEVKLPGFRLVGGKSTMKAFNLRDCTIVSIEEK